MIHVYIHIVAKNCCSLVNARATDAGVTGWKSVQILRLSLFLLQLLWPSSSAAAQVQSYARTLENLSEPVSTRWQHFGPPYFSTNEKLLNRFYSRFDNAGGVTVGVSFQQNLSLLVHARPQLCVIVDYNPGVTEILVPFMGHLIADSPTRRDFLSTLLGASFTADEARRMLDGQSPVPAMLTTVLERTGPERRKQNLDHLRDLLRDHFLSRLPHEATPYIRSQVLKWIDILENEELLTGAFFSDAIAPYKLSTVPAEQARLAGWLSTEENYALVRTYWKTGKIIGVTGDVSGSSIAKLAAYLRNLHLQVTALYISNVGLSVEGHFPEIWFRDLYTTLGALPVTPRTLTMIAHGPWQLTGYVRSLKQAQWVYQTLADVPEQTVIRLHEAPLEILTQSGASRLLPAMRQGLTTLNAPQPYLDLLQQIQADPSAIRSMTPEQFRGWAAKRVAALNPSAAIFKTMLVTLSEAGFLTTSF